MITNHMITSEQKLAAVGTRDAAFDGRFVYAVVTTGVYCRPSCAARPARPENLRFYDSPADAASAGYRPCKRCRPDDAAAGIRAMVAVARYIEGHADQKLTLDDLARQAGLSSSRLQRVFKRTFGVSPKAYQDAVRLHGFKTSLRAGDDVAGAMYGAGFGSPSRIYGERLRNIGMSPAAYRAGGAGESIVHACRTTAYGTLMMAATERGVCFAQFGDDAAALLEQLAGEFPRADLQPSAAEPSPELDAWMAALAAHLDAGAPRPDLPVDLRGTAFQVKVWRFLLTVPEGDVMSYGELATGIGQPRAVRAVASACAANRIAVLVPCHRVLRGDGSVGGYRWGTARKRALLDAERLRRSRAP